MVTGELTEGSAGVLNAAVVEDHALHRVAAVHDRSGPQGRPLSRDALEHRLAKHLATATATCPSLAAKHATMHTLRHTAAMNLLTVGVDISVIALWLGHADTHSTDAYLHADMAIKQAAIDRTRPPGVKPGTYKPPPDILTWLTAL